MRLVVNKFNQTDTSPLIIEIRIDASAVYWTHIRFNDIEFMVDKNFIYTKTIYGVDLTFYAIRLSDSMAVASTIEIHGETYHENEALKTKIFSSEHRGISSDSLELVFLKINPSDEAKVIALVYDGQDDH